MYSSCLIEIKQALDVFMSIVKVLPRYFYNLAVEKKLLDIEEL
jgi:hypothetical protein